MTDDLLSGAKPLLPLDEETIALFSDRRTLLRIEEIEAAMHAFKAHLGRGFKERLRARLDEKIAGGGLSWRSFEEARVETAIGLRPTGPLAHPERDFWPVLNAQTSPGIPFTPAWIGISTTPQSSERLKRVIFEHTADFFETPKLSAPSSWWVQWDWMSYWPSAETPTGLAGFTGEQGEALVERIADWLIALVPVIEGCIKPEAGDLW
ncbi:MAG: hypothetical protein HOK81_03310 [Rhodospirillaceae bacterium]|jgi:hypothetical protein|nr:hypothetical protein [Rhodospirillaceae bacterium]